jgi:hypothetical protein
MNLFRASICFSALLLSSGAISTVEKIPDIIHEAGDQRPLWVAAAVALTDAGLLRDDLFGESVTLARRVARENTRLKRDALSVQSANPSATVESKPCYSFVGQPASESFRSDKSYADLIDNSIVIFSGRATAISEGFYSGHPGSLVRLEGKYIRGSAHGPTFFFYPLARIETAEGTICTQPLGRYTPPGIGDRFLIFAMTKPLITEAGDIIFALTGRQVVHGPVAGAPIGPKTVLGQLAGRPTFDSAEQLVIQQLRLRNDVRQGRQ